MIKETIIEAFKRTGVPSTFEALAAELRLSLEETTRRFGAEQRMGALHGLTLDQADVLLKFYGRSFFTEEIANAVEEAVRTKRKIRRIESKRRGE